MEQETSDILADTLFLFRGNGIRFWRAWKMDLFVGTCGVVRYSDSMDDVRGRMGNSMTSSSSSGFMTGLLGLNSMSKVMVSPSHSRTTRKFGPRPSFRDCTVVPQTMSARMVCS